MSTLGGNRGERDKNAKPKFQQLDINTLYRNSRGETSEPITQKNAVPRKHGMQSLGKVPSARRPPANLPSLKAETSSPATAPSQSSDQQQQQQTVNSSTASWVDSGATAGAQALSANQTSQLNTSSGGGAGGSSNHSQSGGSSTSTSAGATWSAVATGGSVKEENLSQPPLYQSPQFQNEFPSLDGSLTTSASVTSAGQKQQQNPNSNSHDSVDQMSLRPSTDAASWMQQQQSNSGSARGAGGENGQQNYQQSNLNVVPTKFMALMPSFMKRGAPNAGPNPPNSSSSHQQQHQSSNHQTNQNSGGNSGNYQNQARSGRYGGSSYNNDYSNSRDNGPPRHRQQQPPRHSGRQQQQQHDDRSSSYEPEIIVQRPIIKEEELERIDSLARDEGWSKHDEIDYNKKIQYSDDEPDDVKPKDNEKKIDVWRDSDKKQSNGPVSRIIDPVLAERVQKRREEEERTERERKLAAQKKLLELEEKAKSKSSPSNDKEKNIDDKISYSTGDYEKKSEQRGSMDYGKKYGDKYEPYDNYGRGAPANDFKKSSFQSNLPPRFQKQQHNDRHDDRREKPGPPGYKSLHQQDSKNVPFAQQQSYDQRWMYNKQSQQAPPTRRNMSSLSQSSSDDNRRDSNKGYGRRRQESEEDDYRYAKEQAVTKQKPVQAQITRSMSDSSDKLSDHNRSEKSTSREFLGTNVCWADVCENDKRPIDAKSRRVSESSAMSDDQPRTILQRNKPLHDQLHSKDSKKDVKEPTESEKKSVLSESPPKSDLGDEKKNQEKASDATQVSIEQNKKSLESIPEKDQNPIDKADGAVKDSSKVMSSKELDESRNGRDKKTSPRSNRYDRDARSGPPSRGNFNNNYRGNNWQGRRGGNQQRSGRYDFSDSENSDDYDQEWNRNGPKGASMGRKDLSRDGRPSYNSGGPKEGFSPRGEPSRRGRGGAASSQSSGFRRSGSNGAITAPAKNYGPPSSKSPFGSNDEKSSSEKRDNLKEKSSDDDRTKQKQKALSDGLMNKSQKEITNVATKASSPAATSKPDEVAKQHSTEPTQVGEQKEKKSDGGDDKGSNDGKNMMGQRTTSSSSFNSNQSRQKTDRMTPTNVPAASKPSTKPQPINNSMSTTKPMTAPTSHQYPSSMSKPMDPRHQMNRSDPRMDPRNNNNSRSAPRFTKQRDNMPGQGQGPAGNMNRMTGSYWDKNHPSDQMHCIGDDKMSMMQMNPPSGLHSTQPSNNLLNSKTDVMKQQQPPSMQQQQQQQQQLNQNQPMLDGSSLKQTLIFENTSYKSGPPAGIKRPQGPPPMGQQKPQENTINTTINDMIDQQAKEQSLSTALQNLSFGQKTQNDMVDMNFAYTFDSQIGLLTDDRNKSGFGVVSSGSNTNVHPSQAVAKSSSLGLVGAKTGMQNSNILNTDALNMKVASCKKVWEEPSVSMDHGVSGGNDDVMSNFVAQQQHLHQYGHNNMSSHHSGPQSYGGYGNSSANDHNSSLEHFNKSNDVDDGSSYPSPSQQQHMSNMVHSQNQQASMNMKAAEAFASTANVCKVKPTQQQMHQAGLSPPPQMQSQLQQQQQQTYYSTPSYQNMSTIPSPPAVVYNTQSGTGGLYNPYNMDAARAQMYSYPTGGGVGANNSMSFNAFMPTPNLASAPTHEMYQNLSQYRAAVQPFNQTPQLNNPNAAVLISSATPSNSMMSSKSNSQIGAIGSKSSQSGGPTAASGQYGQQYMNHLYHQHQNSYFTNSTAQQANPYYTSGPTSTGGTAAGNYGMFASHGTNVSNGPPPQPQQMANFGSVGSPYPLGSQMLNNLVINQQYRSGPVMNTGNNGNNGNSSGSNSNAPPGGYMKQQHQSQLQDPKLTSPSMNDVNSSHKTFSNQNWEGVSNASTQSNNFTNNRMYGSSQNSGGGNMQSQTQRWPTPGPIQRPSNNNSNGFKAASPSTQFVNYQQNYQNPHYQPRMRNSMNPPSMSNSSGMPQGKSQQLFNSAPTGTKHKFDGDKAKSQVSSSPTKAPGDLKVD